jgi:hypothetical protein
MGNMTKTKNFVGEGLDLVSHAGLASPLLLRHTTSRKYIFEKIFCVKENNFPSRKHYTKTK